MEQVKLLSVTAVLTVLVWAAADSLVNEGATVGVSFDVVPAVANPQLRVEVAAPASGSCELEISGPRRKVEAVQAQAPLTARLRIADRPTGRADLTLDRDFLKKELVEQFNEFRRLTIVSVRPPALTLDIDRMITTDIDISLKRLTLPYEVEPQLNRTTTRVTMRESRYQRLAPGGERPQLDISEYVDRLFRDQPAGRNVTIQVTLQLDPALYGSDATLERDTVSVSATVEAQRATAEVSAVPILLAVSFPNLEKQLRPVARDGSPLDIVASTITVTGPTEDVARLVRGDTRAYGVIRLKEVDLEESGAIKLLTPEYHLPPRLELAQPPTPVEFQLTDATLAETEG
jgi:hypothetical protein